MAKTSKGLCSKLISTLLAVALASGLFAVLPSSVSAATISVGDAAALEAALKNAADGDTIKLTADITYDKFIKIEKKSITFDLNGKILTATNRIYANYAGNVLIQDPTNGQLNVSTSIFETVAVAAGPDSKVEVTSATSIVTGVAAEGGEIVVYGNVTLTVEAGDSYGVRANNGGRVTVDGAINVFGPSQYLEIASRVKLPEQYEATSSKEGYREYKSTEDGKICYVWVKASGSTTQSPGNAINPQNPGTSGNAAGTKPAANLITLKIDDPYMYVNGSKQEIDPGRGTVPMIMDGRTILPIRAIVEAMGGTAVWDDGNKSITLDANGHKVVMWLNQANFVADGKSLTIDVPPVSINGRTMIPLRFAGENLGCDVVWLPDTRGIEIRY